MKESTEPLNVKNFAVIHNSFSYETSRTYDPPPLSIHRLPISIIFLLPLSFSTAFNRETKKKKKKPISGEMDKEGVENGSEIGFETKVAVFPIPQLAVT